MTGAVFFYNTFLIYWAERLKMQVFLGIGFFAMSIVQMVAAYAGVFEFTDSSFLAFALTSVLGWIPLLGSVMGVYGAVEAWRWELWQALLLFFWYVPVIAVLMVFDRK